MVNKIKRTSLQSEIIRFILDYIREHDLNPGDKLPSQENLLAMMGVSRTSLREAMKTLEARDSGDSKWERRLCGRSGGCRRCTGH